MELCGLGSTANGKEARVVGMERGSRGTVNNGIKEPATLRSHGAF